VPRQQIRQDTQAIWHSARQRDAGSFGKVPQFGLNEITGKPQALADMAIKIDD